LATSEGLSVVHSGSVIELGNVCAFEPYSWMVMPGVEVTSVIEPTRWGVCRSIASPTAMLGAVDGST